MSFNVMSKSETEPNVTIVNMSKMKKSLMYQSVVDNNWDLCKWSIESGDKFDDNVIYQVLLSIIWNN